MSVDQPELGDLEKAVNDAGSRTYTVWIAFLLFEIYTVLAIGSVKHSHLLLERELKLPVLAVDLPLDAFFIATPSAIVLFQLFCFVQLGLLALKLKEYESIATTLAPFQADRKLRLALLDTLALALQEHTGRQSGGWIPKMLFFALIGSIFVLPCLILIAFQVSFLPYHSDAITWFHRALIVVEAVAVSSFWHHYKKSRIEKAPILAGLTYSFFGALTAFSIGVATFPTEISYAWPLSRATDFLFEGRLNFVSGQPSSGFFANRIVLPDTDVVALAKSSNRLPLSFRGRDLRGAVLDRSNLTDADFTGANLRGASMRGSVLTGANFGCALVNALRTHLGQVSTRGIRSICVDLVGALLDEAILDRARLSEARLAGASLIYASMIGAKLDNADLTAASLFGARLHGASLRGALLRLAILNWVQFIGADLFGAHAEATMMVGTQLHGASLVGADLKGSIIAASSAIKTNLTRTSIRPTFVRNVRVGYTVAAVSRDAFFAFTAKDISVGEHLLSLEASLSDLETKRIVREVRARDFPSDAPNEVDEQTRLTWQAIEQQSLDLDANLDFLAGLNSFYVCQSPFSDAVWRRISITHSAGVESFALIGGLPEAGAIKEKLLKEQNCANGHQLRAALIAED